MAKIHGLFGLFILLNSPLCSAADFKKIYDNINQRVIEVCSTNTDGSMNVAIRCHYDWIDIPFISYAADPKLKRTSKELTEIITPIHTMKTKDSVYGIFRHALVEINYGMANNISSVILLKPSDETPRSYKSLSGWVINNDDLGREVNEVQGHKKGDVLCLKESPDGYRNGLQVKITKLFDQDHYAVVDTVDEGILGMGNTFKFHYTDLSNLVTCNLDPAKAITTFAPALSQDIKVNNQTTPKAVTMPETTPANDSSASAIKK
jgi:hypothetical protein